MEYGTIIFLNGTSSAGKTTLAHILQDKLDRPFYYLANDAFDDMTPLKYRDTEYWTIANRIVSAMHHTIALFSQLGMDVIVDHVLLNTPETQTWLWECVQLLQTYPVLFVQVECPVEELDRRERARGDRRVGQARWQAAHMYDGNIYDLSVNTFTTTTEICADQIIAAVAQPSEWHAFGKLAQSQQGRRDT